MEEEYTLSGSTTARGQVIERPAVSKTATKPISQSHHSRDDLKKISGIGNFLEQRLNQLGIFRFEQIAKLGKKEIDSISSKIGAFPDRIIRDNWVDQARRLKK
jgi:predicted flap endonuclease-1-like 5' DNA nuclease